MHRDFTYFTYIDDIVAGALAVLDRPPEASAPRVLNIGGNAPVALMDFTARLEAALGVRARIGFAPMQPGDVAAT